MDQAGSGTRGALGRSLKDGHIGPAISPRTRSPQVFHDGIHVIHADAACGGEICDHIPSIHDWQRARRQEASYKKGRPRDRFPDGPIVKGTGPLCGYRGHHLAFEGFSLFALASKARRARRTVAPGFSSSSRSRCNSFTISMRSSVWLIASSPTSHFAAALAPVVPLPLRQYKRASQP